jgi:transposase
VRENAQTVRNWLIRSEAEGSEGLSDAPRPGSPRKVTPESGAQVGERVRLGPRRLGLPYARWPLARLADSMAEQTGIRVEAESVRVYRKETEMVLSRPQHQSSRPDPESQVKQRRAKRPALV